MPFAPPGPRPRRIQQPAELLLRACPVVPEDAQRGEALLIIRRGQTAMAEVVEELENARAAWEWAVGHKNVRLILSAASYLSAVLIYLCATIRSSIVTKRFMAA